MAREYFKCFHSYFEKTKSLTDAEVGRLFRALLKFSATGEAPSLAGRESIAFDFIADEIARDEAKYDETCRKNAENGAKGGKRTVANGSDREREEAKSSEIDKVEGIRKKDIKEISSKEDTKKSTAFHSPTLEQVKERCAEKGYTLDPEAFMAYYNANGWKVGRNKMVSWESALAGWQSREKEYRKPAQKTHKNTGYACRVITDDQIVFEDLSEPPKQKPKNPALSYAQTPIKAEEFDALIVNFEEEDT